MSPPKRRPEPKTKNGKPYGYVLVLRALAKAAIRLDRYPGALRVLCVMAEYMTAPTEEEGATCRVGQDTIAARLGMTRQAVNKHLKVLDQFDILLAHKKPGATLEYLLDTDGLEEGRHAQHRVEARRATKRQRKSGLVRFADRVGYAAWKAAAETSGGGPAADRAMAAAEKAAGITYKLTNPDTAHTEGGWYLPVALARESQPGASEPTIVVEHDRFGRGAVVSRDGEKLTVEFDRYGQKLILASSVRQVQPNRVAPPAT